MKRILNTPRLAVWVGSLPAHLRAGLGPRASWTFPGDCYDDLAVRRARYRRTWYRLPFGRGVCVETRVR